MIESLLPLISRLGWIGNCRTAKYLSSGEYHDNYTIDTSSGTYVLRINRSSQLKLSDQIYYEYRVLDAVRDSQRTPLPLGVCHSLPPHNTSLYRPRPKEYPTSPCPFLVSEYIPGPTLRYEKDAEKAAETLARIHSLPIELPLIPYKNPLASLKKESDSFLEESSSSEFAALRRKLLALSQRVEGDAAKFSRRKYSASYVNTEVNSSNFIVNKRSAYLVDWEKAVVSHPAMDLAHFLSPTTTRWRTSFRFSEKQRASFLSAYRQARQGSVDDYESLLPLFHRAVLLRALSWCYHASLQDATRERPFAHPDTGTAIKYYFTHLDSLLEEALHA